MSNDLVRIGVIGLGLVAQEHMQAISASDEATLICGADLDKKRMEVAENVYGLTAYDDHAKMLASETIDAVCVLTPARFHWPVVRDVIAAGLPFLCEKPLATTLEDARNIRDEARRAGVIGQFGASYRYLPAMKEARRLVQAGAVGKVRLCVETLIGGQGIERAEPLSQVHYPAGGPGGSGMGFVDHGVHMIDAFPWITGLQVTEMFGRGNISGEVLLPEIAMMYFEDGSLGLLAYDEGTFAASSPASGVFSEGAAFNFDGLIPAGGWDANPCMLSIHGSKGALRIFPYANMLYRADQEGVRQCRLEPMPQPNHFRAQIETFARSVRNREEPLATLDDGVRATKAIAALYRSMETRAVVPLNSV